MVFDWLRFTQPDFVFSAKLPKVITHQKKLNLKEGVETDLIKFIELMQPLWSNRKLGPLLIQLPPSFDSDLDLIESFFKILPNDLNFAVEFRHNSWWNDETWNLLKKYNVANTIVDEPLLPPEPVVTADFAYIRWHGHGGRPWYNYHYERDELEPWVPKIKKITRKVKTVYGYFNNHYHGYAVDNCLDILKMLKVITPEQEKVKQKVNRFLKSRFQEPESKQATLLTATSIDRLLQRLLDPARLTRAKKILDKEVQIKEVTPIRIEANVKQYTIIIDANKKIITHDCDDWTRQAPKKNFCKHIGKIFLSLPEDQAVKILEEINVKKNDWQFKPIIH